MSLTPHDLRAIRHADHLMFRHGTPRYPGGPREDWLECGLNGMHSPTGYEQVHAVTLEPAVITIYHHDHGPGGGQPGHPLSGTAPGVTCGSIVVYPRYCQEHQTWIRALRPGDRLFPDRQQQRLPQRRGPVPGRGMAGHSAGGREARRPLLPRQPHQPGLSSCRMIQPITPPPATAET